MSDPVLDALRSGDVAAAVAAAETALRERPDDADAHHLHGVALLLSGEPGRAEASLDRAIELAPDRPLYLSSRSALELSKGDLDAAARGLDEVVALDPNRLGVYLAQAQIAMARGDLPEAEQRIHRALRIDGNHPRVLLALGNLRLAKNDNDGALKVFLQAAERAPSDASVQTCVAVAFLRRKLPDFAERSLRNALALQPQLQPARRLLLSLLLRHGRGEEAATLVRGLAEADPGNADGWALLGDIEALAGHAEAAELALHKALELAPGHTAALGALVAMHTRDGQHQRARELLEARLLLDPGFGGAWELRHALEGGDAPAAEAVARRWLAACPDSAAAAEALAYAREAQGDAAGAEQLADQALGLDPDRVAAQLVKARAELRRDPHQALQRLRPFPHRVRDPRVLQPLFAWLGQAAHAAGEAGEALVNWRAGNALIDSAGAQLPPLGELDAALEQRIDAAAAAAAAPHPARPVFLLGAPGSGVERVALLLRGQDRLPLLDERFVTPLRADGFLRPEFDRWLEGDAAAAAAFRGAWEAGLVARGVDASRPLIDWLPHWDARFLAVLPEALPGARFVLALRDPRDMLLQWLAFGAIHRFAVHDVLAAARWLAAALAHLERLARDRHFAVLVVRGEDLEQRQEAVLGDLARLLEVDGTLDTAHYQRSLRMADGWPTALAPGSWRGYREVLAEAFEALAPAVAAFGYPQS